MKKIVAMTVSLLAVAGLMASCGGSTGDAYQDGSYHAEAQQADEHGWKEYVNVTVQDGKIVEVEYDALNEEDGRKKTEDEDYKAAYVGAGFETYPADYTEKLEASLIEQQSGDKVDTVAGATNSTNSFKKMMKELEKNMKKGNTDTVVINTEA